MYKTKLHIGLRSNSAILLIPIFEYSAASLIVRLESFISRDLCNIWDDKLEYADQRDQITDDNEGMYCHERYEVVYNKLNEIMEEYF